MPKLTPFCNSDGGGANEKTILAVVWHHFVWSLQTWRQATAATICCCTLKSPISSQSARASLPQSKPEITPVPSSSATTRQPEPASRSTPKPRVKFVRGNSVALRQSPAQKGSILDRFDSGRQVAVLDEEGQWSRVRDNLTQREGWIASRFLSEDEPTVEQKKPKIEETATVAPKISPSIIIQRLLAESIANYPGTCACPYSTDRRGRKCGNRSAYSKPGGYSPICFAGDVTKSMIEAYD